MTTPALSSTRLALVPYHAGQATDQHVAWLNDPEVVRYSEQRHRPHTLETQHSYLNSFDHKDSHIWLISQTIAHADWPALGTITTYINRPNGVANMGLLIGERAKWGLGFGTEAWNAVMLWLLDEQRMRKAEAGCIQCNRGMRRICIRSGMTVEGIRSAHFVLDNEFFDLLLYGRFRT
jgi:[ribosomal protein S5]-alanine N-acetyltransferase